MTKRNKGNSPHRYAIFWSIVIIIFSLFGYGVAIWLYALTVISPILLIIIALIGGIVSSTILCKYRIYITGIPSFYLNFFLNIVASGGICAALFLALNDYGVNKESAKEKNVVVERIYSETHHRTKRVGRRYVAQGEPYNMYYMEIAIAPGKIKKIPVNYSDYRGIRSGDSIIVSLNNGFLGFPVLCHIKKNSHAKNPRSRYRNYH